MTPSHTNRPYKNIDMSKLRDIGWTLWDPIGLLEIVTTNPDWHAAINLPFADEYDAYLVNAAFKLWDGTPQHHVVDYLIQIETQHIGLRESPNTRSRAQATVAAILADDSIWIEVGASDEQDESPF